MPRYAAFLRGINVGGHRLTNDELRAHFEALGLREVRVFRASDPENPTIYRRGDAAEAEPAVPEWTFPVDDLFLTD